MKTVIKTLAFVVLVIAVLGFYQGWFTVASGGKQDTPLVTLTVDKDKIAADKDKVLDKAKELGQKVEEKLAPAPAKSPN